MKSLEKFVRDNSVLIASTTILVLVGLTSNERMFIRLFSMFLAGVVVGLLVSVFLIYYVVNDDDESINISVKLQKGDKK